MNGLIGAAAIVLIAVFLAYSTAAEGPVESSLGGMESTSRSIDATVVMTRQRIRHASTAFDGGQVEAVMGRMWLDLRDAVIDGDAAVIDMDLVMSRVEIRVPDDWTVDSELEAVFGRVEGRLRGDARADSPRLVLRGVVVMGGVEIRR